MFLGLNVAIVAGPEAAPTTMGRQRRVDRVSWNIRRAMVLDRGRGDLRVRMFRPVWKQDCGHFAL